MDELRQVLFDSKPHYCIVGNGSRESDGELSMEGLLRESPNKVLVNFHDRNMPLEISAHMFENLGRIMPEPTLEYEAVMLEPLTSVFSGFQAAYKSISDQDSRLNELPDCKQFVFELVSTNMLLEDIFAPKGRI